MVSQLPLLDKWINKIQLLLNCKEVICGGFCGMNCDVFLQAVLYKKIQRSVKLGSEGCRSIFLSLVKLCVLAV